MAWTEAARKAAAAARRRNHSGMKYSSAGAAKMRQAFIAGRAAGNTLTFVTTGQIVQAQMGGGSSRNLMARMIKLARAGGTGGPSRMKVHNAGIISVVRSALRKQVGG